MEDYTLIVARAQGGDLAAHDLLVRRFQDMAVAYADAILGDRHLAEDAAQEAFIEACGSLPRLRHPAAYPSWLRALVVKHCDRLVRRRRPASLPPAKADRVAAAIDDPATVVESEESRALVRAVLAYLPPEERQVVSLFYFGDYAHRDVAAFLDLTPSTVNNRLRRARRRMKEAIVQMLESDAQGRRPSRDDRFARTVALFHAVHAGCLADVESILAAHPDLVFARHEGGRAPLHLACYHGDAQIVAHLLDAGAHVVARDEHGQTPLHRMAYVSPVAEVAEHLLDAGADLDARDSQGRTCLLLAALHISELGQGGWGPPWWFADFLRSRGAVVDAFSAAILDCPQILETLIEQDPACVHASLEDDGPAAGSQPLHLAADHGNTRIVKALLQAGADPAGRDARGRTPILRAAHTMTCCIEREFDSCSDVVDRLLSAGGESDAFALSALGRHDSLDALLVVAPARVHDRDPQGNTPLHVAVSYGQAGAATRLLAAGADVDARNDAGRTPLEVVAMHTLSITRTRGSRHSEANDEHRVEQLLLDHGAECDLFTAARLGLVDRVAAAVEHNPADAHDPVLLRLVASRWLWEARPEFAQIAQRLLDAGAPPDLWTVASLGATDRAVALLQQHATDINTFHDDLAPLHCAALLGESELVRILLEHGAALHARGRWAATPLHFAIWGGGHLDTVALLLDAGADLEARATQAATPLALAVQRARLPVVELLLDRGARIDARLSWRGTPLHLAIFGDHDAVAACLVRRGASVAIGDYCDQSPLHYAVRRKSLVEALLAADLNPDAADHEGSTLLHHAAALGTRDVVDVLVAAGARSDLADAEGRTPAQQADKAGHCELATRLQRGGR